MVGIGFFWMEYWRVKSNQNKQNQHASYESFFEAQNEFIFELLTVPGIGEIAVKAARIEEISNPRHLLNWKTILSNFLFTQVTDPLQAAGLQEFKDKFSATRYLTDMLNLLTSCVAFIDSIISSEKA